MAALTKNAFTNGTAVMTLVAAEAGGDTVANWGQKDLIIVRNTHNAQSRTVTINSLANCDQGVDHDLVITLASNVTRIVRPPFPVTRWRNTNGQLSLAYSDSGNDIDVGAFTMPE